MSEQVGKHKGAVKTLLHEKKELSRLLQIVNSQLQRHLNALEEAGVDTDEFIEKIQQGSKDQTQEKAGKQERRSREATEKENQNTDDRKEPEEDAEDLLEREDDAGNRDFNPNR